MILNKKQRTKQKIPKVNIVRVFKKNIIIVTMHTSYYHRGNNTDYVIWLLYDKRKMYKKCIKKYIFASKRKKLCVV